MGERIKGATLVVLYALLMLLSPDYIYAILVFILGIIIVDEVVKFTQFESFKFPIVVTFSFIFFVSYTTEYYILTVPLFFLSLFSYFVLVEEKLPEKFLEVSGFLLYVLFGVVAISKMEKEMFLFLIAVVWSVDTLAYLTGKYFGRRKLVPWISPKKPDEGAVGGTVGGVLISLATGRYLGLIDVNLSTILMLTLIAIISQFGDIFESYFKRTFNVKDSGNIIPGHGGVLDRLDSSLAIAPILIILGKSL